MIIIITRLIMTLLNEGLSYRSQTQLESNLQGVVAHYWSFPKGPLCQNTQASIFMKTAGLGSYCKFLEYLFRRVIFFFQILITSDSKSNISKCFSSHAVLFLGTLMQLIGTPRIYFCFSLWKYLYYNSKTYPCLRNRCQKRSSVKREEMTVAKNNYFHMLKPRIVGLSIITYQ